MENSTAYSTMAFKILFRIKWCYDPCFGQELWYTEFAMGSLKISWRFKGWSEIGVSGSFNHPSDEHIHASWLYWWWKWGLETLPRNISRHNPSRQPASHHAMYCVGELWFWLIKKIIDLVLDNWPAAPVADGCGVNPKAGEKLVNDFGLLSPTTLCSGHAASG